MTRQHGRFIRPRGAPQGASAWVVANDAGTAVKAAAEALRAAGYPVWVCDGTADDVQIQAAIGATPSGGGKVVLSEGNFTIAAKILAQKALWLQGSGIDVTILTLANSINDDMFLVGAGLAIVEPAVTISDMTLDGNKANNTSGNGIRAQSGLRNTFEKLHVKNFKGHGIYLFGATAAIRPDYVTISRSWIRANGGDGIYVNKWCAASQIEQTHISDNTGNGVTYNEAVEHNFVGNFIWQNLRDIVVQGNSSVIAIVGSVFNGPQYEHILLKYGAMVTIVGNLFEAASVAGAGLARAIHYGDVGPPARAFEEIVIVGNIFTEGSDLEIEYIGGSGSGGTGSIIGNIFRGISGKWFNVDYNAFRVFGNRGTGAKGENSGSATVPSGATTVVVAHGLAVAPTRVMLTARLWSSAAKAWVTTIGAANFTINVDADPGAGTAIFDWRAQVGEG